MQYDPLIEIDGAGLAASLASYGLMDKTPRDMSRDELSGLARAFADCAHGVSFPYWEVDRTGQRTLIIPRDAPADCKPWLAPNGYQSLAALLDRMGASPDEKHRYLGRV